VNNIFHYGLFRLFVLFVLLIQNLNGSRNTKSADLPAVEISKSFPINPFESNRFYFQSSIFFNFLSGNSNDQYQPDIGFGYKISKNLALEGSIFNSNSGGISNQIIKGGVQYYFGSNDTLSWVSSLKKVNFKSLKNYNIDYVTFDISKWIKYQYNFFRFGLGSTFYKKNNFLSKQKGQVNFIFANIIIPVRIFQLGFEVRMNPNEFFYSLSLQKNFH